MDVEHVNAAARRNAAARTREAPVTVTTNAPLAGYAETVARLTRFAEADRAVVSFDGVEYVNAAGDLARANFVAERLAGPGGETVLVRPERRTARVACEGCGGVGYVMVARPGYHERMADCTGCGGTGLPAA